MNDNKTEYVYCMSNKSFHRDLVKVGGQKTNQKNVPSSYIQQAFPTLSQSSLL